MHNLSVYFLFEMCDFQIFSLLACIFYLGFPDSSFGKESACNERDLGLIPGSGRITGEGIRLPTPIFFGFPCDSAGKESP